MYTVVPLTPSGGPGSPSNNSDAPVSNTINGLRCPALAQVTIRVLGSTTAYRQVVSSVSWYMSAMSLTRVSTAPGEDSNAATDRSAARSCPIAAAAATSCPTTSPTTSPTFPEGSTSTSYQSPPTWWEGSPGRLRAASRR